MEVRKSFLTLAITIFVISCCSLSFGAEKVQPTGPYDTLRDYLAALEARGKVLRIKKVDQDKYEGTAFVYRMLDEKGFDTSPAIMFEKVKIDGKWRKDPMFANIFCGLDTAAMVYGVNKGVTH